MEYRILGHLEVVADGSPLPLGSAKQRQLLAALLIRPNRLVSADTLIDELWGDEAPATAANNLQVLVSRLRKLLGHETILRRGSGYLIRIDEDELDVHRFERLRRDGNDALAAGDGAAAARLREALDVWRGPALADFAYEPFAEAEIARLEELRLATLEDRIDADLALGRHRDLVAELERLVAEQPFRERFRAQLILALYRCGRQVDALEAYRATRQTFVDELGIEPTTELRALERRVLEQDAALDAPRGAAVAARRGISRRSLVAVAAVALVLAGTGIAVVRGGSEAAVTVRPSSIAVIDPGRARVVADVALPIEPGLLAAGGRALWATAAETNAVVRLDTRNRRITQTYGLDGSTAVGLAADAASAWVASPTTRTEVVLERFEPPSHDATQTVDLAENTLFGAHRYTPLVFGGAALWASDGEVAVARIDPRTGTVRGRVVVDDGAGPIGWGAGDLWTAYTLSDSVTRVDAERMTPRVTIPLAQPRETVAGGVSQRGAIDPSSVLYAFGSVWVGGYGVDRALRIDPETNAVVASIPVGDGPHALAAGAGALWVMSNRDATVTKIDPRRNAVVARIRLAHRLSSIAFVDGRLWVAVQSG